MFDALDRVREELPRRFFAGLSLESVVPIGNDELYNNAGAGNRFNGVTDRPVVAVSGDGSAMYSIQALWTAAHHRLEILFVIISNREYRVLKHNLDTFRHLFDLSTADNVHYLNQIVVRYIRFHKDRCVFLFRVLGFQTHQHFR